MEKNINIEQPEIKLGEAIPELIEIRERGRSASTKLAYTVRGIIESEHKSKNIPQEVFDWMMENKKTLLDALTPQEDRKPFVIVSSGNENAAMSICVNYEVYFHGLKPEMIIDGDDLQDLNRWDELGKIQIELEKQFYGYDTLKGRENAEDVNPNPQRAREMVDALLRKYPL
jgi:hypothetical protein